VVGELMEKRILIISEYNIDQTMPMTLELVACAEKIKNSHPVKIEIAVPGKDILQQANHLAGTTGLDVIALINDNLERYSAEGYIAAVVELATRIQPALIIIPHSPRGYDYAPQVAVKLNASCITGVSGLDFAESKILYLRQSYYGKMETAMESHGHCTVITVMPGAFKYTPKENKSKGSVEIRKTDIKLVSTISVDTITSAEQTSNLNDAEIIIAAGKGMEKEENMQLLLELASHFPKSAIGGSRVACDLGWIEHSSQIGLTGKTVAPKLYIACGISGAMQHIAGMKESRTIVAINRDPCAAIFQYADIGVVEDVKTFLPALLNEFRKKKV
jgi:electron transfer flavoprotein alpha subunit